MWWNLLLIQKQQECENIIKDCKSQIEFNPHLKEVLASKLSAAFSKKKCCQTR